MILNIVPLTLSQSFSWFVTEVESLYCFSAAFTDVLWTLFTGDSGDSAVPVALWSHLLCSWILPRGIQKHILLSLHHGEQKQKTSHWRCRAAVKDLHAILNLFIHVDLEKCSIALLAHQWVLSSEWVPSEWESKQLIKTLQYIMLVYRGYSTPKWKCRH